MSRVIEAKGQRLAIYLPSSSWGEGLNFVSEEGDFLQVGVWGYDRGIRLQPHIHNEARREISRTQEAIFVRSGSVAATIFDEEGGFVERLELGPGDTLILLKGGHGYEILEDGTQVLEVKNGPFPGAEVDRRRIEWKG
ncbi:hypothetical protein ES703_37637 [subsurface metagenome]